MEDEFIEVLLFPLSSLLSSISGIVFLLLTYHNLLLLLYVIIFIIISHYCCTEYQKQHDCAIDFKLYSFAYGLSLTKIIK